MKRNYPIAINYRGTTGAGKTTLVREIMNLSHFVEKTDVFTGGRRRPLVTIHRPRVSHCRNLVVLGHYEAACGGCDTIKELDDVFALVRQYLSTNCDVLFEGLILSGEVNRSALLMSEHVTKVWGISTPVEQCIANVYKRRLARGVDKPFKEKNSTDKHKNVLSTIDKLYDIMKCAQDNGIDSEACWGDYNDVKNWTLEALGVTQS